MNNLDEQIRVKAAENAAMNAIRNQPSQREIERVNELNRNRMILAREKVLNDRENLLKDFDTSLAQGPVAPFDPEGADANQNTLDDYKKQQAAKALMLNSPFWNQF